MAKLSLALAATLAAGASAFVPAASVSRQSALSASWDPMSLGKLGQGEAFDTFPGMFPDYQYLNESEIKHGRMSMLAWTGIWATHVGGMGLGMHIPGMPEASDWTTALGVVQAEQPALFGAVLLFISLAEGESVGHSGDNWRGMSTKEAGNLGFDVSRITNFFYTSFCPDPDLT